MRPFYYIRLSFIAFVLLLLGAHYLYNFSYAWLLIPVVIYISLLVLGAINIQWNFFFQSYNKGNDLPQIALTFDDGPGEYTEAILDILKEQNIPAAFFNIGKNAAANTTAVKRMDADGHVVGNHSYDHGFNFDWQSTSLMLAEIQQTNNLIKSVIGKYPRLFRPPYGVTNPNLAKAIKNSNMHSIGWSLRSFDTKAKDARQLLTRMLGKLKNGDIILLHDTKEITCEILTEFIIKAKQKGFTFVRIDKLLSLDAYA